MNDDIKVEKSSGNVFADLGVANPEEALAKAELARRISQIISKRHMNQKEAATLLGIDQPKVSALMRGRLRLYAGQDVSKSSAVGGLVERLIGPNPFHNRADEC